MTWGSSRCIRLRLRLAVGANHTAGGRESFDLDEVSTGKGERFGLDSVACLFPKLRKVVKVSTRGVQTEYANIWTRYAIASTFCHGY
jgi:hypothetical protein